MCESNWRRIETAARDKEKQLLWARPNLHGTTYSVVIGQFDAGLGWVVDTGVGGMIQIVPSHWMPLPDGPNSN